MKLFLLRPCQQFYGNNSMALRALLFSTQAPTRQPSGITPLKRMIMRAADPTASVVPILENWVQQGNEIKHSELRKLISNLRRAHRFNHALQMSQWMGDKGGYEPSAVDFAFQLELTSRVGGIRQVEKYFHTIPYHLRGYKVYCALLTSYADHDCLGKGKATMKKISELGFLRNALSYNAMLSFHSKMREYNKMNIIAEEMREKGINYNRITYNILLEAYRDLTSVYQMEDLFMELEGDPLVKTDWYHYLLAAEIYWDDEDEPSALKMLKKSEESMGGNLNKLAFELVTLHAAVGNKDDVHRLWSLYKLNKRFYNKAYLCMIKSLIKIDDMDGAERIWEEWFSKKKVMDFRIPKAMVDAYAWKGKGKWKKAEAIVFRMTESGIEPDADTFYSLGHAYVEADQMDKAVETSMKAISVSMPGWIPGLSTIPDCFRYLASKGDVVAMEELHKMLKEHCGVPASVCDDLKNGIGLSWGTMFDEMKKRRR